MPAQLAGLPRQTNEMFAVGKRTISDVRELSPQAEARDTALVRTPRHPSRSKKLKDFLN